MCSERPTVHLFALPPPLAPGAGGAGSGGGSAAGGGAKALGAASLVSTATGALGALWQGAMGVALEAAGVEGVRSTVTVALSAGGSAETAPIAVGLRPAWAGVPDSADPTGVYRLTVVLKDGRVFGYEVADLPAPGSASPIDEASGAATPPRAVLTASGSCFADDAADDPVVAAATASPQREP